MHTSATPPLYKPEPLQTGTLSMVLRFAHGFKNPGLSGKLYSEQIGMIGDINADSTIVELFNPMR